MLFIASPDGAAEYARSTPYSTPTQLCKKAKVPVCMYAWNGQSQHGVKEEHHQEYQQVCQGCIHVQHICLSCISGVQYTLHYTFSLGVPQK